MATAPRLSGMGSLATATDQLVRVIWNYRVAVELKDRCIPVGRSCRRRHHSVDLPGVVLIGKLLQFVRGSLTADVDYCTTQIGETGSETVSICLANLDGKRLVSSLVSLRSRMRRKSK